MKKKVLIIHGHGGGAMGSGHMIAARAIEDAGGDIEDLELKMMDMLDYVDAAHNKMYDIFYRQTVMKFPKLWGVSYYLSDTGWFGKPWLKIQASMDLGHIDEKLFVRDIKDFAPDVVVCPFWLPLEVLSLYRKKGIFRKDEFRICGVVTDYYPHRLWIHENIDRFFVPNEWCRDRLIKEGIEESAIRITGIPIEKIFMVRGERKRICEEMGLSPDDFILSVLGGGFGAGRINGVLVNLIKIDLPAQILVTTGKNKKLKDEVEQMVAKASLKNMKVSIYGFVPKIEDVYSASDLVISKSGGLVSSEIMALGCPMIIMDPIPGQEEYNRDYLVENHAAVFAANPDEAVKIAGNIMKDHDKLRELANNVRRIARPDAARDIIKEAIGS